MDDLHERMEQLARRVDAAAAPDLERVRQRHTRRRRTSALAVGSCVALVAIFAASRILLTDDAITSAKEPQPGAPMVWPQDDVDTEWRSDPEQLLQRFAYLVLGWSEPGIVSYAPDTYEMLPEACPATARCIQGLTLTVEEGDDGRWSISSVSHPDLAIEVGLADPRVALTGGSSVAFDLQLPDNVSAHVGMVASNGCRDATAYEVGLDSGPFQLQLPVEEPDDPACDDMGAGYLFAYATDDTTVPVGDPLLEAAGIEYPWLTVIPIYLQMEEPDATSTATPQQPLGEGLDVSCLGTEISLGSDRVAAGPMGVAVFLDATEQSARPTRVLIDDSMLAETGSSVLSIPPGPHTIRCLLDGDIGGGSVTFEVEDIEGYWTDPSVDCAPPDEAGGPFDADSVPVDGDPDDELLAAGTEFIRSATQAPGTFGFAGYAASPVHRTVVLLDDGGSVVARADFSYSGQDWFPESYATCDEAAVT